MSISPIGDIVLEAANAADPQRLAAGIARLESAQPASDFTRLLRETSALATQAKPLGLGVHGERMGALYRDREAAGALSPLKELEAVLLQSFVAAMLPAKAEAAFGKGFAGGVYRSMLAEHLGRSLARSGGIGLAAALERRLHRGGAA